MGQSHCGFVRRYACAPRRQRKVHAQLRPYNSNKYARRLLEFLDCDRQTTWEPT